MTNSSVERTGLRQAAPLLVPAFILLELFGGLVQGWIVPLLETIGTHYRVGDGALNWVLTVGLLSSAVSVPLMTMLADRFGAKVLLVVCAACTAIGSLLIAFAPSFPLLLIGVIVQGPVAALLPLEMATLKHHRSQNAARIVGALVGTLTIGVALGALFGGTIMEWSGNLVLTQSVPAVGLAIITLVLLVAVPATPGDSRRSVDWWGALLLGLGVAGIMYGLANGPSAGWLAPDALIPAAVGALALAAFVLVELRATTPLFDLALLRRIRLGVPLALGLLAAMVMFGSQTPMVLYLTASPEAAGYGAGVSPGAVGLIFAITGISSSLGSFATPLLRRALSVRTTVMIGTAIVTATMCVLATGPGNAVFATACFAVSWFALGILLATMPGIVVERAPQESAASISGIYNTGRTIGGSISGAVIATLMTVLTAASAPAGADLAEVPAPFVAFQLTFAFFALLGAVATVLAMRLRDRVPAGDASTVEAPNTPDSPSTPNTPIAEEAL